jgi:hypothetical protein
MVSTSAGRGGNLRLVVTGGRDFFNRAKVYEVLDKIHNDHGVTVLIEGEARGADTLAREWAEDRGIRVEPYPANWSEKGRAAGPIRNQQMITEGKPDAAAVFYDRPRAESRGTADMHRRLVKADVTILEVVDATY